MIADVEEFENLDASEISQKTECERSLDNSKKWRLSISCGRWFSKIVRKRLRIPGTHSETGENREERGSQRRFSRRSGRVSTCRTKKKMNPKHEKISGPLREISSVVITLNREFNFMCQKKKHSLFQ